MNMKKWLRLVLMAVTIAIVLSLGVVAAFADAPSTQGGTITATQGTRSVYVPKEAITLHYTPPSGTNITNATFDIVGQTVQNTEDSLDATWTPTGSHSYTVTCTATDASGQKYTASTTVEVVSLTISQTPTDQLLLVKTSVTLRASVGTSASDRYTKSNLTYQWGYRAYDPEVDGPKDDQDADQETDKPSTSIVAPTFNNNGTSTCALTDTIKNRPGKYVITCKVWEGNTASGTLVAENATVMAFYNLTITSRQGNTAVGNRPGTTYVVGIPVEISLTIEPAPTEDEVIWTLSSSKDFEDWETPEDNSQYRGYNVESKDTSTSNGYDIRTSTLTFTPLIRDTFNAAATVTAGEPSFGTTILNEIGNRSASVLVGLRQGTIEMDEAASPNAAYVNNAAHIWAQDPTGITLKADFANISNPQGSRTSHRWYMVTPSNPEGELIDNATNLTLTIKPQGTTAPGTISYYCEQRISTGTGSDEDTDAPQAETPRFTVNYYDLAMDDSNSSVATMINQSENPLVLEVKPATGSPTFPTNARYQWSLDGQNCIDNTTNPQEEVLTGSTNNTLKVVPKNARKRVYKCRVLLGTGNSEKTLAETSVNSYAFVAKISDKKSYQNRTVELTLNITDQEPQSNDNDRSSITITGWQRQVRDASSTSQSYAIIPNLKGLTASITEESNGTYAYRANLQVTITQAEKTLIVNGKSEKTVDLNTDPIVEDFYGLVLTPTLGDGSDFWDAKKVKVQLTAEMHPSLPEGKEGYYYWTVKDPDKKPVSDANDKQGNSNGTFTLEFANATYGTYEYECKLRDTSDTTKEPIATSKGSFTLYEGTVDVTETPSPSKKWLTTAGNVELTATVNPSDTDLVYTWYCEDRSTSSSTSADGATITWQDTDPIGIGRHINVKPANAGQFIYHCVVTKPGQTAEDTIPAVQIDTNTVNVYGVRLDVDTSGKEYVKYGENFTIVATPLPGPELTNSGTRATYKWYVQNQQTLEFEEITQTTPGYTITPTATSGGSAEPSATSTLLVQAPEVGSCVFRCEMTIPQNISPLKEDITESSDATVNVWYDVRIDGELEGRIGDDVVELTADVSRPIADEGELTYVWSGTPAGVNIVGDGNKATVTIRGGTQEYNVTVMQNGKRVGYDSTEEFSAYYRLNIETKPSNMVAAAEAREVTMTASPDHHTPSMQYVWQERVRGADNQPTWQTMEGTQTSSRRVSVENAGSREFRCLAHSGQVPDEDNNEGVGSETVSAFTMEVTKDIDDKDNGVVSAGISVPMHAKMTPDVPDNATFLWEYRTDTDNWKSVPNSNRADVAVTPAGGGNYKYRCTATLPGGDELVAETDLQAKQRSFRVTITTDPADTTNFPLDQPFCLIASVNKNPDDTATYQWQVLEENGWQDLTRSDAEQQKMTILPSEESQTTYRCMVTVTDAEDKNQTSEVYSDHITVTVTENGAEVDNPGGDSWDGQGGQISALVTGSPDFQITRTTPAYVWGHGSEIDKTTAADVTSAFTVPAGQTMDIRRGSTVVQPGEQLCTGDILYLYDANQQIIDQATVVVLGDVLGKGTSSVSQIVCMASHISGKKLLRGAYLEAADMNLDGRVSVSDLTILASKFKEKSTKRSA